MTKQKKRRTNYRRKRTNYAAILVAVICLIVVCFSGYKIVTQLQEYKTGTDTYNNLAEAYTASNTAADTILPTVDFNGLKQVNDDVIGWIYGEDTVVNYPIVQGDDNSYYLHHLFDKTYNSSGSIFMDANNSPDFTDFNTIIYGHNMKNDKMFACLMDYKEQEFYDTHQKMVIITPEESYEVVFFAGYVTDANSNDWQISFTSDEEKSQYLTDIQKKSCFKSEITPTVEDHIVTLSTCSYEIDNGRFLLFGILKPL